MPIITSKWLDLAVGFDKQNVYYKDLREIQSRLVHRQATDNDMKIINAILSDLCKQLGSDSNGE